MNDSDDSERLPVNWDDEFDVVVVGFGYAGSVSAIEASDAGGKVLLVEKMPDPGGISVCSGGNVRVADDADKAFSYLKATNAGTTPDDVLRALAEGMAEVPSYFERLAAVCNAKTESRPSPGNYPFPGADTFQYLSIGSIPGFDPAERYAHVSSYLPMPRAAGMRLFRVLEDNIAKRDITVWLDAPARRLLTNGRAEVRGVAIDTRDGKRMVKARRAVILACGGFEANEEMKTRYWQEKPVMSAAYLGNTGDGIRMAQDVGADLWHMWHYHGTYGFRHPDPDYPYGVRLKRLPDWVPGQSSREGVRVPFILLDQRGRRYMNEYQPYTQDTSQRPMARFDPITQTYPRIPSYLVLDESTRWTYPLCSPTFNDRNYQFDYSEENLRELEESIVTKVESLEALANAINVDESELRATLERWNSFCDAGEDTDFGRTAPSMMKIETPPFYYARVWPMVQNTHGGPVHNVHQQVMDGYGEPIPRLYAAGELGGVFGHLYLGGGNLAECFVGGWIAGRHAAGLAPWD
ncbi:MAG: FAD-binding protein [Gammaproteobacteria bacterium]|nr:FAD-binding protein [Gammaproteobacteria bacterium]